MNYPRQMEIRAERPMQASLIVGETYSSRPTLTELPQKQSIKQSFMAPNENIKNVHHQQQLKGNMTPQTQDFRFQNGSSNNIKNGEEFKNIGAELHGKPENRPVTYHNLNEVSQARQISIHEKIQKLSRLVQKHEWQIESLKDKKIKSKENFSTESSMVSEEEISEIVKKKTQRVFQYVLDFKSDIQYLKQQVKGLDKKMQRDNSDLFKSMEQIARQVAKKNRELAQSNQIMNLNDLSIQYFSIEKKIVDMEINLKQQLEALQTDRFTVGPIKSKCPPIVIQYIENFRVKTSNSQSREIPSTTAEYFIDNEGYLLDQNGFYLLNARKEQVQLGRRHLQLLEKEGVPIKTGWSSFKK